MMKKHRSFGMGLIALATAGYITDVNWHSTPAQAAPKTAGKNAANKKNTAKGIAWKSSFYTALKEAKRTRKPLMVDFYTVWCSPCQVMDKKVLNQPQIIAESRKWITVKVDADKEKWLASKYTRENFPTYAFLRSDGVLISRLEGYQKKEDLLKAMQIAHPRAR